VPGFPIRTSTDQRSVDSFPWLFAVTHVLHRFETPRHPPLALYSLEEQVFSRDCFRSPKDARARSAILKGQGEEHRPSGGLRAYNAVGDSLKTEETTQDQIRTGSRRTESPPLTTTRTDPPVHQLGVPHCGSGLTAGSEEVLLRKEVIQPHLPVRLPCYDFTPITDPTFDGSLLAVGPPASGVADFRGVTGGVYKARERIHPGNADPGLLATPAS
jgi:hypothetical protein